MSSMEEGLPDKNETNTNGNGEMEVEKATKVKRPRVFVPGVPIKNNEELVFEPSAYVFFHEGHTGAPCLSFDVIPDDYGSNREAFPLTSYFVAGTQSDRPNGNSLIVMKVSNITKMQEESDTEESEDGMDSTDSEDEEKGFSRDPVMETALIKHHGTVNRIRCTKIDERIIAAAWSEEGKVTLVNLNDQIQFVNSPPNRQQIKKKKSGAGDPIKPLFVFKGHLHEGYGMDWSSVMPGVLATGDCKQNIHVWQPRNETWHVDQRPLKGHTASVEDLQWSPSEPWVLASCSVDKSLRIWDTRQAGSSACKLVVENAHQADVNVISWNWREPLLLSGGDDAFVHVWDLRQFKSGRAVASMKHHSAPITTIEWSPHDSSVFASGGADDQIAIWDLAAERDPEAEDSTKEELKDLPQQLLFIHQGQEDIKELHWHKQIPGFIASTANSGYHFFRPISV